MPTRLSNSSVTSLRAPETASQMERVDEREISTHVSAAVHALIQASTNALAVWKPDANTVNPNVDSTNWLYTR